MNQQVFAKATTRLMNCDSLVWFPPSNHITSVRRRETTIYGSNSRFYVARHLETN
jgi:hypothetical protein